MRTLFIEDSPAVVSCRIARACAVATALLCLAARAQAQTWTMGGYVGGAWTQTADVTIASANGQQVLPDVTFRSESLESPIYYGYRVGHRVARAPLFVEGELIHLKVIANEHRLAPPIEALAMTHGMNFILMNAVWMTRITTERVRLIVRAGVGITIPHVETRIRGEERGAYQLDGAGWQLAPGLALHATGPLYVTAEYKFTSAHPEVEAGQFTLAAPIRTHHGVVGVSATF